MKATINVYGYPTIVKKKIQSQLDAINSLLEPMNDVRVGGEFKPMLISSHTITGDNIPDEKLEEAKVMAKKIAEENGLENVEVIVIKDIKE